MTNAMYAVNTESTSAEVVPVVLTNVPADPTGGTIGFAFTALGTDPTSFTSGTWGTYDATNDKVAANSPTVGGASASIDLSSSTKWLMWCRFTVSGETVVRLVGTVPTF